MTTISDIFNIPTQVHQGDFVLRLTEGVTRPGDTLGTYVVTPQLEVCFDQAFVIVQLMKTEVTLQLATSGRLRGAETERVHHTAQPHAPP